MADGIIRLIGVATSPHCILESDYQTPVILVLHYICYTQHSLAKGANM